MQQTIRVSGVPRPYNSERSSITKIPARILSRVYSGYILTSINDIFQSVSFFLQNLNIETTLEASNGRRVKALEIFTYSIRYLHTRALEVIQERTGDDYFSSGDIQWVLTVPAIWKPAAKQFMREAAYQAKHSSKCSVAWATTSKFEFI